MAIDAKVAKVTIGFFLAALIHRDEYRVARCIRMHAA
jgi:hypothetical protein